jgi:hypothetical protein
MAAATFGSDAEADNQASIRATLEFIIKEYQDFFEQYDELPWYVRILDLTITEISDEILYKIYIMTNTQYVDIANELVKQDGIDAMTAFRRIERLYPEQDGEMYQQLLTFSESLQSNRNTETFEPLLREHIVAQRPVAPEPTYLLDPDPKDSQRLTELLTELNTAENAGSANTAELLTAGRVNMGLGSRDDAIDELETILTADPGIPPHGDEVAKIIGRFRLGTDVELFRLFGPVNVQVNDQLHVDDVCSIYGGCRMFTCNCFEGSAYDISEDRDNFWFVGYCKTCLDRIQNLRTAFRVPLPIGGWVGCYCSPECAAVDAPEYIQLINANRIVGLTMDEVTELRKNAATIITNAITIVFGDLRRLGVYRFVPSWIPKTSGLMQDDTLLPPIDETDVLDHLERAFDEAGQIENDVVDEQTLAQRFPGTFSELVV